MTFTVFLGNLPVWVTADDIQSWLNAEAMGRPVLSGDATSFTYYPGQVGLPADAAPRVLNKSWTITADIESRIAWASAATNLVGMP